MSYPHLGKAAGQPDTIHILRGPRISLRVGQLAELYIQAGWYALNFLGLSAYSSGENRSFASKL